MNRKKKRRDIIFFITGILILTVVCIAGHNTIKSKLFGKTEVQGESFEMFQKWMKFDKADEMELCLRDIPDLDEIYQQYYRIDDEESMNQLWEALKKRTYVPTRDYDEPQDAPFFFIRMENHKLNRAALFCGDIGTDGKDRMHFSPLKAAERTPIDGEFGDYLEDVYEMDEVILDIMTEVIKENIKTMNLDNLYQCIKEGKLTYPWVQHYYYKTAEGEERKEVYQKLDFGPEGCTENILEIPLEEGGKIILQYNNTINLVDGGPVDQSIHYAVLIKPNGEKIDLLEKEAKEKLEKWMKEQQS